MEIINNENRKCFFFLSVCHVMLLHETNKLVPKARMSGFYGLTCSGDVRTNLSLEVTYTSIENSKYILLFTIRSFPVKSAHICVPISYFIGFSPTALPGRTRLYDI